MQALVETNDIDIFGTVAVRAIVQHKWQTFGLALWLKEFCIYCLGLAFLVALGILDWRNWQLQPDRLNHVPPAETAVISALFCVVIIRSLYREAKQFVHSIPDDNGSLLRRMLNSDHLKNFWNLLDLLHITLGISAVALVWAQSPKALPVLAITSFLRWWGTLFYLQVKLIACVDMLKLANTINDVLLGIRQTRSICPHANRNCQGDSLVFAHYAHQHSGDVERVHPASQAPVSGTRFRCNLRVQPRCRVRVSNHV
jgi:hypothetical protein